tara:strand:+ start:127859 stop:128074 length:216 start_codon:yes stop_codon:yes gene_type:complete
MLISIAKWFNEKWNEKYLLDSAGMDSPIPILNMHPYGRRRTGTKGRVGKDLQGVELICAFVFIAAQMYKLN